jgi:flagellin
MALTVLNNISSLTAENSLSNTQMNLQKTLTQLSTGLKINSGSDDSAGLSIANGMQANIAALTQSQQNASNGVGMLQTADGALSQVTTLLNRAVTLATEGASGNITATQSTALDTEFQSIAKEITQIGQTTNFNGTNVFSPNSGAVVETTAGTANAQLTLGDNLTAGSVTTVTNNTTGASYSYTAKAGDKVSDLNTALAVAATVTLLGGTNAFAVGSAVQGASLASGSDTNNLTLTNSGSSNISMTSTDAEFSSAVAAGAGAVNNNNVFISDSSTTASTATTQISTAVQALSANTLGLTSTVNLASTSGASAALTLINAAITTISAQRGVIGASVNRLNAATNVMSNQVQNLTSASNSIQNADIGKTVAAMTQYNILQSTGMAALQQSNQAQQAVLKLVQ